MLGNLALRPLLVDSIALILFVSLSVGYHVYYATLIRHQRTWSIRLRMQEHRVNWVESILKRGERILAVQALRNLIMTNTFLASTMILLVAFIANFVVIAQPDVPFAHPDPSLWAGEMPLTVKGVVLLLLYAFAFVMFLSSLRNLNHLSVMLGIELERIRTVEQRDPIRLLAQKLAQVETMTSYGRRAVYFSLPVYAWFFSPWAFAAGTFVIWLFFIVVSDFTGGALKKVQRLTAMTVPTTSERSKSSDPSTR